MKITIRQTKRVILIEELNARKEFFPEDPIEKVDRHVWFLAKAGKQIVGWAGVTIKSNAVASICRTGVFPEFQNRGVKRRLVKAMERYAMKQGCTMMTSYCATDNVASANSLIKSGYKIYWPEFIWAEGSWIYWRKRLTKRET
jgi:predicted GNAT family acetyltransferase